VAARNATQGKPTTTKGAVLLERFNGVCGTAWIITARGRQQRTERELVAANNEHEHALHNASRPRRSADGGAGAVNRDIGCNRLNVGAKRVDGRLVGLVACTNGDVERGELAQRGQQRDARDLAKPSLEPVAIDGGVLVTRHDDPDARRTKRGSTDPDIEVHGPNSLPLSNDSLNIEASRQPVAARKSEAVVTRLRTCSEA
jgi:hypothetical protein